MQSHRKNFETDVLIVGCGIAGSIAAISAADLGYQVTIITKEANPSESNTYWAQGGIVYKSTEDQDPASLIEDILVAGVQQNNLKAVKLVAEKGPRYFEDFFLKRLNFTFDKNNQGQLCLIKEGGHSFARIAHCRDATGKGIENTLVKTLQDHPRINLIPRQFAIDILTTHHHSRDRRRMYEPLRALGAYVLDLESEAVYTITAKSTVIASGGLGQIYLRSTNPAGALGDGLAMAARAGARVINLEYIQFHPTAFHKTGVSPFLISEAVRGAGARLVNLEGKPFMEKYAPEWLDLAPRDVVARSIYTEMSNHKYAHVYLDLKSYVAEDKIKSLFPNLYAQCLQYKIDITRDPIPVAPAAHYSCGGIWVDEHGRTSVSGLYSIGEASCTGVHGANRLASVSLLEGLTWGALCTEHMHQSKILAEAVASPDDVLTWEDTGEFIPDPAIIDQDLTHIRSIMWNYVGLARDDERLSRAIRDLRHLEIEILRFYRRARLSSALLELRNGVATANLIAQAAWHNKTSLGCHYLLDPKKE